jgi:hypothetical protein
MIGCLWVSTFHGPTVISSKNIVNSYIDETKTGPLFEIRFLFSKLRERVTSFAILNTKTRPRKRSPH